MYLCHHLKLFYLMQVLKFVTALLCLNSGHMQLALSCCQPQPCMSLTAAITWGLLQITFLPSAAAGSAGANLGLLVLKVPFPVGKAEVTAPLLCGGSRALLLPAAATKCRLTLSHWPALHVAGVKKNKECKKKSFFSSLRYFPEQEKSHPAPLQGPWLSPWEGSGYSSVPVARGARQHPGEPD